MNKLKLIIVLLCIVITLESFLFASFMLQVTNPRVAPPQYSQAMLHRFVVPFYMFNTPISNDTEYNMTEAYTGSWKIIIRNQLTLSTTNQTTEAQIAISPEYESENLSIPTIIVQERADGRLRIEYYAQDWPKTYGFVLYNSTSPSWLNAQNVTLSFVSYGPPSVVNPQLAPFPNGNLTITVGQTVVLSNYPIAWANLSSFYVYGLAGSQFTDGTISIEVYALQARTS